ncbi:MAG: hypothetical protein IPJ71_14945 [Bdellovibrionales bacterium]|nr:hypothetical protein [Bdellovibrionales bacterium]
MKKKQLLCLIFSLLLVGTLSSCKVIFSTLDDDNNGNGIGGCATITPDSDNNYVFDFDGSGHLKQFPPSDFQIHEDALFFKFRGTAQNHNYKSCTGGNMEQRCLLLERAPAPYQFLSTTEDHEVRFGLYQLSDGEQQTVGTIQLSRKLVESQTSRRAPVLCVENIQFIDNTLAIDRESAKEPWPFPKDPSIDQNFPTYLPDELPAPGILRGEIRITTKDHGIITLKDDSSLPPPPANCTKVPLQASGTYDFQYISVGDLILRSAKDVVQGASESDQIGFYLATGKAIENCTGRCPLDPVNPRFEFARTINDDHSINLSIAGLRIDSGNHQKFEVPSSGTIRLSAKRILDPKTSRPVAPPDSLCIEKLKMDVSLYPFDSRAVGSLKGPVSVYLRDFGVIELE